MSRITSLKLENVGQIKCADVTFGDLTVLVGPQATGKSIFLQLLRLALDKGYISDQLRMRGADWGGKKNEFLDLYLGEGMCRIWRSRGSHPCSVLRVNGRRLHVGDLASPWQARRKPVVFYIPAQRVLSLANGWPKVFTDFAGKDPFAVRDFSDTFRLLMEREINKHDELFPRSKHLKQGYRNLLSQDIFAGFELRVDRRGGQKRLILKKSASSEGIPFMAWSAGQREFIPLLMGLYWLLPDAHKTRRRSLEWVIIEEPETGLHPRAISAVMLLMADLLWRGYRVCLSTHSPHVLDVVWALEIIQRHKAEPDRLLEVFGAKISPSMREVAASVMKKRAKVYYFDREGMTHDISALDPGASEGSEAGWGGLTEFSGRIADVVASVVNQSSR
jgi:hypothetical protein